MLIKITRLILLFLIAVAFVLPISSFAGDATYIYDDLGCLIQVIDEQANITNYNYDSVGNLLSITKATGHQPPQITAITPSSALQGDTLSVTITGDNVLLDEFGTTISSLKLVPPDYQVYKNSLEHHIPVPHAVCTYCT